MNLHEIFSSEIPEGYVRETKAGSGIFHLPIREVKIMAWQDFYKWGTSNHKFNIFNVGHEVYASSSVQLALDYIDNSFEPNTSEYLEALISKEEFPTDEESKYFEKIVMDLKKGAKAKFGLSNRYTVPKIHHFTFIGATTFNIKTFLELDDNRNDNFEATALALATCHAFKNCGRRYGYYLNNEPLSIHEPTIQQKKLHTTSKAITSILRNQNK